MLMNLLGARSRVLIQSAIIIVLMISLQQVNAAEITAREVSSSLFNAKSSLPPDFSGKDLSSLDLANLDFKGANLADANLYGTDLSKSNLSRARLSGARLDRATITTTNFEGADLSRATILRPNILSTMEMDVSELPNFESAKMTGVHINGRLDLISFKGAELTDAFFGPRDLASEGLITPRIEMNGCDFTGATIIRADFSLNSLQYAKFINADATGANFANTDLSNADFTGANLTGSDFTGAKTEGAHFNGARGLESTKGLKLFPAEKR